MSTLRSDVWAIGALAILASCGGSLRGAPPRTSASAAADVESLADFLEAAHPDPFRFVPEETFRALVASEADALRSAEAPSEDDVARAIQRVVASLHDSHMAVAQPMFQSDRASEVSVLPFTIEIVGGELFVDASSVELPIGTTIESIDGRSAAELVDALGALVVFEGANEAARSRAMASEFAPLFHVAFGMRSAYSVTVRRPDGSVSTEALGGVERAAYERLRAHRFSSPMHGRSETEPSLPSRYDVDATTAVLRMPSFAVLDAAAFEARLGELVSGLVGVPRVILDLRGNEGGYRTYGIALANHLVDRAYVEWERSAVRVRTIPRAHASRVEAMFGTSLGRLRVFPDASTNGLHTVEGDPLAVSMVPEAPRIAPRLVVLVDGLTNSAANELALALRSARPDATFVGEEIGGECERHVGELPVSYATPAFGVRVLMSLVRIDHVRVAGCALGHGLVPDVVLDYDRASFVSGTDPYVAAARAAFEVSP